MVEVRARTLKYPLWIFGATAMSVGLMIFFPMAMRGRTGHMHPHGFCYLWDPALVWSHVLSDGAIGAAYIAIAVALVYFVYRGRDLIPFTWMFLAFGLFILTCGGTHLMDVWTLWRADFWASAAVKIVTAVASVATAVALPPLVPQALQLLRDASVSEERRVKLDAARAAREHAEEANRLKDEFLATLSHELRTPLNAILGWSQVLRTGTADPAVRDRALEAIHRNAQLQSRMVDDLLDVSRIISGDLPLHRVEVDLRGVVRSALDTIAPSVEDKRVSLDVRLPGEPVQVSGDPARLQQIVWNLVANAVKFTPAAGRVEVSLDADDASAVLTVRDTGIGMEAEFLERAFEHFTQASAGSTREFGGLGVGLAIVRHLTELHGGSVDAESAGAGRGSTFRVRLPLVDHSISSTGSSLSRSQE